ncbi:hypothetical protein K474DRAFT_1706362 [Panus rudis PR-1116 ss-1]|nr:hypothetical protein K474DRAFT_1706362 [Panus rudis PR-1116 ss-1]
MFAAVSANPFDILPMDATVDQEQSASVPSSPLSPSTGKGLYVPVHKRDASITPSSAPTSRASSPTIPQRPSKRSRHHRSPQRSSKARGLNTIETNIPYIYSARDLLSLSQSPLSALSASQSQNVQDIMSIITPLISTFSSSSNSSPKKRSKQNKKPSSTAARPSASTVHASTSVPASSTPTTSSTSTSKRARSPPPHLVPKRNVQEKENQRGHRGHWSLSAKAGDKSSWRNM